MKCETAEGKDLEKPNLQSQSGPCFFLLPFAQGPLAWVKYPVVFVTFLLFTHSL